MKSRTSSCKAALRKDLTRFWPVWAVYILGHIFLQIIMAGETREFWYLNMLVDSISLMAVVNCGFGFLTAVVLFGDLFNTRMCGGIHSLPLRREEWFGVHAVSGMLFSLIPTALMTVFMEAVMVPGTIIAGGWQIPLYWWVICNLQFLFFFGLAVFCVMCTGSWFASAVVYGMSNCFSLVLWVLANQFYTPLLHGVITQSRIFNLFSPVSWLTSTQLIETKRTRTGNMILDDYGNEVEEFTGSFSLILENWKYLAVVAVLGVVLLILARQMYKRRQLETAGDFMAVKWLEPVFQVVFTVICAAAVHGFFTLFFGYRSSTLTSYVMAGLGLAAGWFAGRMFLERNTRVFKAKNFAGLAALTAALVLSLFITWLDPLGIEDWVPEADQVTNMQMVLSHRTDVRVEDPAEIEDFLRLHKDALVEKNTVHPDYTDSVYDTNQEGEALAFVSLTYWLDNGWISEREYYIRPDSEAGQIARDYASRLVEVIDRKEQIRSLDDLRYAMKRVDHVSVRGILLGDPYMNEAFLVRLVEAINADCEAGTMVQSPVYHPEYIVEGNIIPRDEPATDYAMEMIDTKAAFEGLHSVHLEFGGQDFFCYMNVYADCENTMAVLEETGVMEAVRAELRGEAVG